MNLLLLRDVFNQIMQILSTHTVRVQSEISYLVPGMSLGPIVDGQSNSTRVPPIVPFGEHLFLSLCVDFSVDTNPDIRNRVVTLIVSFGENQ